MTHYLDELTQSYIRRATRAAATTGRTMRVVRRPCGNLDLVEFGTPFVTSVSVAVVDPAGSISLDMPPCATETPHTDVSPAFGTKDAIRLAIAFSEAVKACYTVAEFNTMNERNRALPIDSGICHSHDFSDANMLMLDAFRGMLNRDPYFIAMEEGEDEADSEADMRLWGDAWAIAKATSFFA